LNEIELEDAFELYKENLNDAIPSVVFFDVRGQGADIAKGTIDHKQTNLKDNVIQLPINEELLKTADQEAAMKEVLPQVVQKIADMEKNSEELTVVIFCNRGNMSKAFFKLLVTECEAANVLQGEASSKIASMKGGFEGWKEQGYPIQNNIEQ